jgi:hypothetical protein
VKSSRHESVGAVLKSWLLNGAGKVMGSQSLSLVCGAGDGCSYGWVPIGLSHL